VSAFFALITREVLLAVKTGGAGLAVTFFVLTIALLPFAVGAEPETLGLLGPGFIFLGALLAQLLTLERLVQADLEDGTLDLFVGAALPLELAFFGKALAHWVSVGLPITLLSPLTALLLGVSGEATRDLALALLLALPGFSAIGATIAALTAGVRRGSLLLALLVLPLAVPFLIFGAAAAAGRGPTSFLFLTALSLVSLAASLLLGPSSLKSQLE
jgi:heme exporter protein B